MVDERDAESHACEQLNLITDSDKKAQEDTSLEREKKMQHAMLGIQKKFGKNAILKGFNLEDGAKTIERNRQIGGHKA